MPMHDWSRVAAGVFHAFHTAWIAELQKALNRRLPREYYALAEQRLEDVSPDVLTLHAATPTVTQEPAHDDDVNRGLLTVTASPPRVALTDEVNDEDVLYQVRQRRLVVRHVSGDEPVAAVEIVSPANKHSLRHVHDFVVKSLGFLEKGLHLLMVDPLPPTPAAPQGMHAELWGELSRRPFPWSSERPLTLASYAANGTVRTYVEPFAVGEVLAEMPLFLTPERYVLVPLETAYVEAWAGFPDRWRRACAGK